VVVPSGDTSRLRVDVDSDSALLLRVILLSRRVYCCFVSSSSLLIKGDLVRFVLLWHRYRYRFGCLRVWSNFVVVVVVVVRFVPFERC